MSFDFSFTPSCGPSRADAKRQGLEAVAITRAGGYATPSGRRIDLSRGVARALASTHDYLPDAVVDAPAAGAATSSRTKVAVVNATSLAVARGMAARGLAPLVLNFASAKNPGGGFLKGARAQEESLARSSALYACLEKSRMYAHHRASSDCLYSDWMIHSPHVPVFRDDDNGVLLEEPYDCAFLTTPAPNAGVILQRDASPRSREDIERTLATRARRVLAICAAKGHRHLVLGAWGCGVFANDPAFVARTFGAELEGAYAGVFDEVIFAVLDWSADRRFIRPFVERFAS